MEWKCPHCKVNLSVSDERLPDDWFFSKCSKCSGYSIIRKAAVKAIHVSNPLSANPLPASSYQNLQTVEHQHPALSNFSPPLTDLSECEIPSQSGQPGRSKVKITHAGILLSCIIAVFSGIYFYGEARGLMRQFQALQAQNSAPAQKIARNEIQDRISHQSMAPERTPERIPARITPKPRPEQKPETLRVRTTFKKALLRQGPGKNFEIIGIANPETIYTVKGWRDNWLRISDFKTGKVAWIRNDLVTIYRENE